MYEGGGEFKIKSMIKVLKEKFKRKPNISTTQLLPRVTREHASVEQLIKTAEAAEAAKAAQATQAQLFYPPMSHSKNSLGIEFGFPRKKNGKTFYLTNFNKNFNKMNYLDQINYISARTINNSKARNFLNAIQNMERKRKERQEINA